MSTGDGKALLLDFGGVISVTMFERHASSEQTLGLEPGSLTWRGPFDPAHDELWRDMCADKIPEREYWARRAAEVGRRVGILSNELELFYGRDTMDRLEVLKLMDSMVDATHTHILKPDPRAYALGCEALGLPPDKIVFVDDQKRNVEGARQAGLDVVHFDVTKPAESYAEVERRLGLV